MVAIMKKIFVVSVLLVSQMACSQASTQPALHVHYRGQNDMTLLYTMTKPTCDKAYKAGLVKFEWKVDGDESLLGKSARDEYWSLDGSYHVHYEVSFVPYEVNPCQLRVVPKISVKYTNFLKETITGYQRIYQEWDDYSEQGLKMELKAFQSGNPASGRVEKESWGVKKVLLDSVRGKEVAKVLKGAFVGESKSLGKDIVAGRSCEVLLALPKFAENGGIDNKTCGWNPHSPNLPDRIILKVYLNSSGDGLGGTTVAESVNEHAAVPLSILLPPSEWRAKPVGSYLKSDKTDGKWVDGKEQAQLRKKRGIVLRKEREEKIKQRNQMLIEKLKGTGTL